MTTSKNFQTLLIVCCAIFLSACQQNTVVTPVPTPLPEEYIPTAIMLTAQAAGIFPTPTEEGNSTPVPLTEITADLPTHQPTSSAIATDSTEEVSEIDGEQVVVETPLPTAEETLETSTELSIVVGDTVMPDAEIKIYRPGPLSKVSSPFRVVANLAPGPSPDYLVLVELLGEDGRLLVRKLVRVPLALGHTTSNFITDIEFEIRGVSELGRLVISTEDEFGRMRALNSISLILLAVGDEDLNAYGDLLTDIYIQQPAADVMIQSEALFVTGFARIEGDAPLLLELVSEGGKVLGFGNAILIPAEDSEYGLFVGEISYSVSEQTWVRLIIKVQGERIPGIIYITSIVVLLTP